MNQHALVVGGSGMLADVSLWLVDQGYHVSVIGRDPKRLASLVQQATQPTQFTTLAVDYTQDQRLQAEIASTIRQNGPIDLVVAWIHSNAPNAWSIIDQEISKQQPSTWQLFHVRGSQAYLDRRTPNLSPNGLYREIILGFVLTGNSSRWLTHQEIASGVIHAIQEERFQHEVGTLEPWERRP